MDLTDAQWNAVEPYFPVEERKAPGRCGARPWTPARTVLNGVLWVLRTGAPWKDFPERYPPYQTCTQEERQASQSSLSGRSRTSSLQTAMACRSPIRNPQKHAAFGHSLGAEGREFFVASASGVCRRPSSSTLRQSIVADHKSPQSGFCFSMCSSFHARRHFLMTFSLSIAEAISANSSKCTSLCTPYFFVKPPKLPAAVLRDSLH